MMQKRSDNLDSQTGIHLQEIVRYLDTELRTAQINDASCNGLQVQGTHCIKKAGLVVDASMEAYRQAAEQGCQLIIAHHGIIWDGIRSVSGATYEHLRFLFQNDLNLYASHLPLDLHPELGNNAQLAAMLGLSDLQRFGLYKGLEIGYEGVFTPEVSLDFLVQNLCELLGTECMVFPFGKRSIGRLAIVSGGAAFELNEAIEKGIDCYLTGEPSHASYHTALEAKINVIFAGHYHTEKPGVQALGEVLSEKFGIESVFIDIPTPV